MKITIDISDFYLDDEQDIESGLKSYIKSQCVSAIMQSIQSKVDDQITRQVKDTVEKTMYSRVTKAIESTMKQESFKSRKGNGMVSIEEYVKETLEYTGGWQNFNDAITKIAKSHADEIKRRYDLLFASQIVAKMSENGLLKDDAIKLLLDK